MVWVRIDDSFSQHPKVVKAGPLGMAMQVAALCYCNRLMTDGFVPKQVASGLLNLEGLAMCMWQGEMFGGGEDATWQLVVQVLVDSELWVEVPGGWKIHDFLEYQPSKQDILRVSAIRKEAGRRGGEAKSEQFAKQNGKQNGKQRLQQNGKQNPSKTLARTQSQSLKEKESFRLQKENDDFEKFWKAYPSRGKAANPKKPARQKFDAAVKHGADPEKIIAAAEAYRRTANQEQTKPQYIAQAITWLNQERWLDGQSGPAPDDDDPTEKVSKKLNITPFGVGG